MNDSHEFGSDLLKKELKEEETLIDFISPKSHTK